MNPLYNLLSGNRNQQNPMNMMSEFHKFARNFKGDPKKEVENLLKSGQMSQEQLNKLQTFAGQFKSMIGMK